MPMSGLIPYSCVRDRPRSCPADWKALSAATRQRLSGLAEGVLHPAMLATLVYRFGIPGHATDLSGPDPGERPMLPCPARRAEGGRGIRRGARFGLRGRHPWRGLSPRTERPVGFYETDNLVSVRDVCRRSRRLAKLEPVTPDARPVLRLGADHRLGRGDACAGRAAVAGGSLRRPCWAGRHPVSMLNLGLTFMRLGVLVGMARAYEARPVTYWLSPLADLPVAARLWQMASRRRRHAWRGRDFGLGDSTQ